MHLLQNNLFVVSTWTVSEIMGSGLEVHMSKNTSFNMTDKFQWTEVLSQNTPLFFKR